MGTLLRNPGSLLGFCMWVLILKGYRARVSLSGSIPKGPKYLYSRMWVFHIRNNYHDLGKPTPQ